MKTLDSDNVLVQRGLPGTLASCWGVPQSEAVPQLRKRLHDGNAKVCYWIAMAFIEYVAESDVAVTALMGGDGGFELGPHSQHG